MVEEFLRVNPHLKPVRLYNLFERFLNQSNNNILILFNIYKDRYEMHSLRSWRLSDDSFNAIIDDEFMNGWVLHDYLANNLQKFGAEVASDREITNSLIDSTSDRGLELLTMKALKTVETMVGREI